MSTSNEAHSDKPQIQAAHNGVVAELSNEALYNLTGFFDVLIQMDLQKQRNERDETNGNDI